MIFPLDETYLCYALLQYAVPSLQTFRVTVLLGSSRVQIGASMFQRRGPYNVPFVRGPNALHRTISLAQGEINSHQQAPWFLNAS